MRAKQIPNRIEDDKLFPELTDYFPYLFFNVFAILELNCFKGIIKNYIPLLRNIFKIKIYYFPLFTFWEER